MCGIAGFIGQSKNARWTHELSTRLFKELEARGTDAAGVWGVESGDNGGIIYHKEPIKSSEFIKSNFWGKVQKFNPNLMLLHARASSSGAGHASINKNNHPFVSSDKKIGLVHNGVIYESEFLQKKYETFSDTDSEFLLRIYEAVTEQENFRPIPETPDAVCRRMEGIREIWSIVNRGAMAVALGERHAANKRSIFLFRNDKRPLWLADMRDTLGQVFFFSSVEEIWQKARRGIKWLPEQKLIELPTNQVWYFELTDAGIEFMKFNVDVKLIYKDWNSGDFQKIIEKKADVPVVATYLDDADDVVDATPRRKKKPAYIPSVCVRKEMKVDEDLFKQKDDDDRDCYEYPKQDVRDRVYEVEHEGQTIKGLIESIMTQANNMAMEGSMTADTYADLLQSLEQTRCDLEGTLRIMES